MNDTQQGPSRRVSARVHAADRIAELVISSGGFLVLAAVLGICVYLTYIVVPLFSSGSLGDSRAGLSTASSPEVLLDPYANAFATIAPDGSIDAFRMDDGVRFAGSPAPGGVTAVSVIRNGQLVAIGHEDGTVRLGAVGFDTASIEVAPDEPVGRVWGVDDAVLEVTTPGRARRTTLAVELGDPVAVAGATGPVRLLDYRVDPTGRTVLLAAFDDGTVAVNSVRVSRPLGGGKPRVRLTTTAFNAESELPRWAFVTADGTHVLLLDDDGRLRRHERVDGRFVPAETVRVVGEGRRVAAAAMLLGSQTLLVGDSQGAVQSWTVATDPDAQGGAIGRLVRTHRFDAVPGAPVLGMSPSIRDRSVVLLGERGAVRVRHATSEKTVAAFASGIDRPIAARMMPKNDGVFVLGADGAFERRTLDPGYPEFSVKALFGKVHYEGQTEASYVYQSSAGDDAAEIKLSLMPLIFGTLKATVFAMLFAVPIGVLAAVYTSEFLSHRVRRVVKPAVEMMASLPSVVLGFIAAMVVAPFVRAWLPEVLIGLVTVPLGVLTAAHAWQLVPMRVRRRLRTGQHISAVVAACMVGVTAAVLLGPVCERLLFAAPGEKGGAADMRRWLNGEYGGAWAGWFMVLIAPGAIFAAALNAGFVRGPIDRMTRTMTDRAAGTVVLLRFLVMAAACVAIAGVGASLLGWSGLDPRDSILGTFSPRNTLVVSMIMGFAVIPIIYTISDDALQAVPDGLRAASLGAGATPWQTAVRVVLPVAASGIFSACMIGFGRAVGETMIVLMATGNTPEMSWNIFGGFRTLAANIAVELPEAPKGETHFRVLFLCGLVLFVMTFVINTSAEVVRQVVRARNAGL